MTSSEKIDQASKIRDMRIEKYKFSLILQQPHKNMFHLGCLIRDQALISSHCSLIFMCQKHIHILRGCWRLKYPNLHFTFKIPNVSCLGSIFQMGVPKKNFEKKLYLWKKGVEIGALTVLRIWIQPLVGENRRNLTFHV